MIFHSKPWLDESDTHTIQQTLTGGMIARGERVAQFEQAIADYLGMPHAIATSSGTSAIIMALMALGIGRDQEVILPTYVCHQVRDAVIYVGATPVLADVGPMWSMTADHAAPHITNKTAAIIVVHTYGFTTNVAEFSQFGLPIIEDACQAFGALHQNQQAGTAGTLGVFSFHATKCLTTAEGGMVVCRDPQIAMKLRALSVATPMPDIGAALGLNQLQRYEQFLKKRAAIATRYHIELADLTITLPPSNAFYFRYPIRVSSDITNLIVRFAEQGVHVRRGIDALLHDSTRTRFIGSETLYQTTLSLPIYPALSPSEQDMVIATCRRIFS